MRSIALVLALSAPALSLLAGSEEEDRQKFDAFVAEYASYRREYTVTTRGQSEYTKRFAIFRENLRFFDEYNAQKSPITGITQGITPFADMTEDEWTNRFHGMRTEDTDDAHLHRINNLTLPFVSDPNFVAPVTVDWRKPTPKLPGGAVAPVKNQGNCGSCWDFAGIAALEGAHAIATGKLVALSEQEVLDCCNVSTGPHPCWGCKGGAAVYLYGWVQANGGITTEANYPYVSGKNDKVNACNVIKEKGPAAAKVTSSVSLPRPAPDATMMEALAKGPVAISVSVAGGFRGYKTGVLKAPGCGSFKIDHGVSLVGYGAFVAYCSFMYLCGRQWVSVPACAVLTLACAFERTVVNFEHPNLIRIFRYLGRRKGTVQQHRLLDPPQQLDGVMGRKRLHEDRDGKRQAGAGALLY